jgi:ADP-ribose pyrophosphatase
MNPIELKFLRVRTEKHPTTGTTLEYLHHHHAVAVLILDTNEEKTLLVNQYRPGNRGNLYEVPAGLIDENENPEEAMFREVLEETGYSRKDLKLIYSYPKPPSPPSSVPPPPVPLLPPSSLPPEVIPLAFL